jgi:heat shock protein HslJ
MRRLLLATLIGAVAMLGTACSDTDCGALPIAACSPIPPQEPDWPEGLSFRATEISTDGETMALVPGTELTVTFSREYELEVYAGCNTLDVKAHIEGEDRIVADQFLATAIGCSDDRLAQDAWITDFFESSPQWSFDGPNLLLTTETTAIELAPSDV